MDGERAAFLRAICEAPDDDGPRLVYADWLDEHGEPERAEFIRLQIRFADVTIPGERRAGDVKRVNDLLATHGAAWWAELPHARGAVRWKQGELAFFRGFAHDVTFQHAKAWREHADRVFATAPVERLTFGSLFTERTIRPVLASPYLGRLAELTAGPLDLAATRALADNPHLTGRLRKLWAGGTSFTDRELAALVRAPGFAKLLSLGFRTSGLGPAGAAVLADAAFRPRELWLLGNPIGDDGAEALAASPALSAVEHLALNATGVGDRGVAALARSAHLTALRFLNLGDGNPITDVGAVALAGSSAIPRLEELHLWGTQIGAVGARALAAFAERHGLRVLNFRSCPIPRVVIDELRGRLGQRLAG